MREIQWRVNSTEQGKLGILHQHCVRYVDVDKGHQGRLFTGRQARPRQFAFISPAVGRFIRLPTDLDANVLPRLARIDDICAACMLG